MGRKHVPRRVRGAEVKKLSTQLFDYQIELINELSKATGYSNAILYRYAVDYFMVCFKGTFNQKKIALPEQLEAMSERQIRELAELRTTG